MKRITIFLTVLIFSAMAIQAQVAINDDGSAANASAVLDVKSTSKGFMPPRMTATEIALIASPAAGLLVFNTDDNHYYFYDDGAGEWKEIELGTNTLIPITTVYNPITGETWMDRNLGASQVATSSNDAASFGDLYQWGRDTEGHEIRTAAITSVNASTPVPNDGNSWDGLFIKEFNFPNDWLVTQDNTLWQGVNGTNNPCPTGFRIPTETEWNDEMNSWATNDPAGAFGSPLKLPTAGYRYFLNGSIMLAGEGNYWSSTISSTKTWDLHFSDANGAGFYANYRAYGFSVRCIKD